MVFFVNLADKGRTMVFNTVLLSFNLVDKRRTSEGKL